MKPTSFAEDSMRSRFRRTREGRSRAALAIIIVLGMGSVGQAQVLRDIQLGFKPLPADARTPSHKVGLWTPLSVRVGDALPNDAALVVHGEDSEDHVTVLRRPLAPEERGKVVLTYVKPGRKVGDIRLELEEQAPSGRTVPETAARPSAVAADLNTHLYLCLGSPLEDLPAALVSKELRLRDEGLLRNYVPSRFAVYEDDAARLPDRWIGYDGVDLAILTTGQRAFLEAMIAQRRAAPLIEWVAGGGHLVVSLHPRNVDLVQRLLTVPGPTPIPVVPTVGEPFRARSLVPVEVWAGLRDKPFPPRGQPEVAVVRFDRTRATAGVLEVQAQVVDRANADQPVPLIARMAYGFGSITYIAFPLDDVPFTTWAGRGDFLRTLVDQIGPRYLSPDRKEQSWRSDVASDLGTQLHLALDNFDVPMAPFGYVALLILLYILLVGPIDYFVLRRVFGRLEWTWFTFPLIVLGVCLAVYFKLASERRVPLVNRINLVDLDLRTPGFTSSAERPVLRGMSFFMVRSPRIRTQTITASAEDARRAEMVSWFGRPDPGPAGMGRAGSQSVSRKSYAFRADLRALEGVPFADRGTKAFVVEWQGPARGGEAGLTADLTYHPREAPFKVTGRITNGLGSDLEEVCLFIFDRVYRLEGGIAAGATRSIGIKEIENGILPGEWKDKSQVERPATPQGSYDPAAPLRFLMFHERLDGLMQRTNHALRRLDWSWRLRDDPRVVNVAITSLGVREAILTARLPLTRATLTDTAGGRDGSAGFPDVPVRIEPFTPGTEMTDETYVRAILPLRPQP